MVSIKCHQNTDFGDTGSKSTAHGDAEAYQEDMEFLWNSNDSQNNAHVLH